ncbi:MAG: tetratricopeptide repeat protein [Elusimicrobia bacterium]|nr:tetratricopeptide repeat protein [Elusimicrobiota bacterium]
MKLIALAFLSSLAAALPQAQKQYDTKDYRGAAEAYQALLAAEPRNAGLHYNLGNCLFKQGRLGQAVASYQRAFDINPRDSDIRHNLDFALKRSGEELVSPGVPTPLFVLAHFLSLRELAGLQWLGCWAFLLLASFFLLDPRRRAGVQPWLAAAFGFWVFFAAWWLIRGGLRPPRLAVVISPTAQIRSGPGESSTVSFTAPEGRRVQILSENGAWLEVGDLKEGSKGWMKVEDVDLVWEKIK